MDAAVQDPGPSPAADPAAAAPAPAAAPRGGAAPAALLLIALAAILAAGWILYTLSSRAAYPASAARIGALSGQLAREARVLPAAGAPALAALEQSRSELGRLAGGLLAGGSVPDLTLGNAAAAMKTQLAALREAGVRVEADAALLLGDRQNLAALADAAATLAENEAELGVLAGKLALLRLQAGAPAREVAPVAELLLASRALAKTTHPDDADGAEEPAPGNAPGADRQRFDAALSALAQSLEAQKRAPVPDPQALGLTQRALTRAQAFGEALARIEGHAAALQAGRQAAASLATDAAALGEAAGALGAAYEREAERYRGALIALFAVFASTALLGFGLLRRGGGRDAQRAVDAEARTQRQQEAILLLMNEIQQIAGGDLTVRASVTEEITGAIADSVNYTVEEFSAIVARINSAAETMAGASTRANEISEQLRQAAETQAAGIRAASGSVLEMARSIEAVSEGAARSTDVARQSLMAAEQGASAVQNSVLGMNEIRVLIQETSKRIKRLGESSQQIGEIVALIADLTERTQVLALNAAIQAASAGEAGRGFTVVAEEVQRLAERSAGSSRQIALIVRGIQTDTQDAVAAMERSTRGVVEGAKLSDAAGQALAEISEVSRRLATLIEDISVTTQNQARSANRVASGIQDILLTTSQTTEGSRHTAEAVGELARLSRELQLSVANFKLAADGERGGA
jgi:twitching motility protein PilJ